MALSRFRPYAWSYTRSFRSVSDLLSERLVSAPAFATLGAPCLLSSSDSTLCCFGNGPRAKRFAVMTALDSPMEGHNMFCYQCEQTSKGTGCTTAGVCGKTPEVAALQDLLIYSLKGLAGWTNYARREAGWENKDVERFINAATFSTLTNVNFDEARFQAYVSECHCLKREVQDWVSSRGLPGPEVVAVPWFSQLPHPFLWDPSPADLQDLTQLVDYGQQVGLVNRAQLMQNETLLGLHELLTYGLKGAAAYTHHADMLGKTDASISHAFASYYHFLCSPEASDIGAVLGKCLELGQTNLRVMQLLDEAHNEKLGTPEPTVVSTTPRAGPAILVTGHDLADLRALLEQTAGSGVNVYTHGEMLPGHSYPELKKFPHLAGHYGGAWYKQKKEFSHFPGSILVTTNCVLDPLVTYQDNMFTTGETGVRGVSHVPHRDFSKVIARAQELPGFGEPARVSAPHTVGFGRQAVLGVAGQVVDAVQQGQLRHIFLIGGCDGSEPQRKYYANLSKSMPAETMVLTLGCGKFRLLGQEWGLVPGTALPRLVDMGQCNDAYGAIVVADALAKALGTDVNGLPLSLDLSWFEQKAVAVLLTLLSLGVKDIRVGPRLPAFLTPEALQVLVDKFGLRPADVKHPEADVQDMLQRASA